MEFHSLKAFAFALTAGVCFATAAGPASSPAPATAQPAPGTAQPAPGTAQPGPGVPTNAPTTAPAAVPGTAMTFTDAEIMGLVLAVDTNEIEMAKAAEKMKLTKDGKAFAKMIRKEHSKNAAKVLKLGKTLKVEPARPQAALDLRAKGAAALKDLATKTGTDFEPAFIAAMVAGHAEALQLIDNQLIPNAIGEALKTQLAETRTHVANHLEQAKRLQGAQAATKTE